jgi:Flp pilus assembly protein CpaB
MASIAGRSGTRGRGNTWIALAAVALGPITALLVINYLRTQDSERRTLSDASIPVVVANREIPIGANITSDMLELKHVTPDLAVDPKQAQTLFLTESQGDIRLSLRPFGERVAEQSRTFRRAAVARAAFEGRTEVAVDDIREAAHLALPHRRRTYASAAMQESMQRLDQVVSSVLVG